ncbi:MAG: ester cyclase [Candidatus Binatia bacterium]
MNTSWAEEWAANFADLDKLMDMYADDAQFEDIIIAHKESGKAALAKFFAAAGNPAYAENTFTAVSYCGNADGGAVEWLWQAKHHAGKILGVPSKGKETSARGVSILTFKNGKIATQHDYWDAAAVLRQLEAIK